MSGQFRVIEVYINCWASWSKKCAQYFIHPVSFFLHHNTKKRDLYPISSGGNWLGKFRLLISLNVNQKAKVQQYLIYTMYRRDSTSYPRVKLLDFASFWWSWQFWETLVRFFCKMPLFGICLLFFSWLALRLWVWGRNIVEVKCHFKWHHIKGTRVHVT